MSSDLRDALRSKHPPEYHAERLDAFTVGAWRYVFAGAALLALGALADVVGLIG